MRRTKINAGFADRRTLEQHARYDSIEVKRFKIRVSRNPKELARLAREAELAWARARADDDLLKDWLARESDTALLRRQAD